MGCRLVRSRLAGAAGLLVGSHGTLPRRMGSPTLHRDAQQPVLFVAREPDETLRTFLPVVDRLRSDHRRPAVMLFHHTPGDWARAELSARDVPIDEVALAGSVL